MKLNLNFDGLTLLRDWWEQVKANFQTIQNEHNALKDTVNSEKTRLTTEINQRTNADLAMSSRIGAEETARLAADTKLNQKITAEAAARSEEDTAIIEHINKIVFDGKSGSVWQNNCYLEWQNDGMEMLGITYDKSNSTAEIELYIGGRLIANGAYIYDDNTSVTLTIDHEGVGSYFDYKTVQLSIELSTGKTGVHFDESSGRHEMKAYYSKGFLTVDIGTINIYHEPFSPYVSVDAFSFGDKYYYNNCPPLFLPALHKHGAYDIDTDIKHRFVSDEEKSEWNSMKSLLGTLSSELTSLTTAHQIYVPCDGDHDELKLQAAIDSVPENSVIYPVGTCVITNDNIQMGVGGMADTYGAILNIKEKCTLDGRYCHSMTFVNSNPQTNQVIFLLQANAKMRNLDFSEDLNSTANPPVPSVIYNRSVCEISNCKFTDLTDTGASQNKIISITGSGNVFKDNTLSRLYFSAYSSSSSARIAITADVTGNTFAEGYADSQNSSEMMSFTGLVSNNRFDNMELLGGAISFYGGIREGVHGNKFNRMPNAQFDFHCSVVANTFATCSAETEWMSLIQLSGSASNQTLFTANTLSAIRATADNVSLISVTGEYCKVSDNIIVITQAVGETAGIDTIGKAQVHHNTVKLSAFAANSTTLDVFRGSDGAVITDNITDAASLGTFDNTCVVERNITAEVS